MLQNIAISGVALYSFKYKFGKQDKHIRYHEIE